MACKDAAYARGASPSAAGRRSTPELVEGIPNVDHRHGNRRAELVGIAVLDAQQRPTVLLQPSTRVILRISIRAREDLSCPVVGFLLRNHLGIDFAGTDTRREDISMAPMHAGEMCTVDFSLDLPELYPAFFSFSAAVGDGAITPGAVCDWVDNAVTIQMSGGENQIYGYIHLPCRVELNSSLLGQASIAEAVVD
jgi:hypothetical protein